MKFIKLEEKLPTPNKLVFIKRKNGNIYYGHRSTNNPISTNEDASRNCYWYGNPIHDVLCEHYNLKFHNNFSDVTIDSWSEIQ